MPRINKLDVLMMCDNNLENVVGGAEESLKIICSGINKKYSVGIIQPGKIRNKILGVNYFCLTDEIRLKTIVRNPLLFIRYIIFVKQIIDENNPKVIHTHAQISFFIVALLKKVGLISKSNYLIHTERGLWTKYSKMIKHIFYFFMKELNTLVTTTKFNMRYWREDLTEKRFPLDYRIIENTAGELFEKLDESLIKVDESKVTIGFAGRYTDWKNWPLAVEISEKLNAIIGEKLLVKMAIGCLDEKALAETKCMYDRLNLIFGDRFDGKINITLEEMDKFYYDLDVFILTSEYNSESFGRTLVEAMSRKTVVLTTDSGGSVEVVGNRSNVHNIAEEFAHRVVEFFNNKNKMNKEKEYNLRRVKKVYSLENNLEKHLKMYKEVIARGEI